MNKIKLIIFVFAIIFVLGHNNKVNAEAFKAGETLENVYRNKEKDGKVVSSVEHRLIRNSKTNEVAYCLEPFADLIDNYEYKQSYQEYSKLLNLKLDDYERITLLVYYGYGYYGHEELKWHTITQLLIWKTVDKNADFYWVDKPNGKRINPYQQEIAEIESLINNHYKTPNFTKQEVYSIDKEYSLVDNNGVLSNFNVKNTTIQSNIDGSTLKIKSSNEGSKRIEFEKVNNRYSNNAIIFIDNLSQNIIQVGNVSSVKEEFEIAFASGSLSITKIDSDTLDIYPRGKADLIGAIYNLYDNNENFIAEMIIHDDNKSLVTNLAFGTYKLKEVQSGAGYYLNEKVYEIEINEDKLNVEIAVDNEVIQSKIIIKKYYGNEINWQTEANIAFEIYDSKGELYSSVATNRNGIIEITLPYDEYTIVQLNSTPNYQLVSSFQVIVDETSDKEIIIELYDLEIETPDTNMDIISSKIQLFCLVTNISLCGKVLYV